MKTFICYNCKKPFVPNSHPNRPHKYCSSACYGSFVWLGRKHKKSSKRKMSRTRQGKYKGTNNPHWKGGSFICKGYKYIYSPLHPNATKIGYVLEHRLVMEKHLGRYLTKQEIVHHTNHNKLDNHLSNLALYHSTGFHSSTEHPPAKYPQLGEKNPKSKLSNMDIPNIRKMRIEGMKLKDIAQKYNIGLAIISKICRREAWSHL